MKSSTLLQRARDHVLRREAKQIGQPAHGLIATARLEQAVGAKGKASANSG